MSHVASLKLDFTDLECLKLACQEVGLEWREGQQTFNWYGEWLNDYAGQDAAYKNGIKPEQYGHCTHAMSIPGTHQSYSDTRGRMLPYEVGVIEREDKPGVYSLVWDFYNNGNGLKSKIGDGGDALKEAYSRHLARKKAKHTASKLSKDNPTHKYVTAEDTDQNNVFHARVRRVR